MANEILSDESLLQREEKVKFDRLDDEFLGIDGQAGMCYSLNGTANAVWERLERPLSFGTLCRDLAGAYHVDEATVRADLPELLADLKAAGLISISGAPASGASTSGDVA